jgi:small subunit ribosomal protein S15
MSITKERTAELVAEFGENAKDTGNSRVQVAILTERIRNLTEHLKINKKDNHTRRGLLMMVGQRKGLLNYIRNTDITKYRSLIAELNLRK